MSALARLPMRKSAHVQRMEALAKAKERREVDRLQEQAEAADVERGIAETMALGAGRGEAFIDPKSEKAPRRRKCGLDWLLSKERITLEQMEAGLRYGDDYRTATDVSIRSCANSSVGGGDAFTALERRQRGRWRLEAARDALSYHTMMVFLCNEVAGEGRRLREISDNDTEETVRNEATLLVALDLLAKHYGIVQPCKQEPSTLSA